MKKSYKKMDESAVSGFTALMIIIIIGLMVWQFVLPYFDIESITDTIENSETANYDLYIRNVITQQQSLLTSGFNTSFNIFDVSALTPYEIILRTNLITFSNYRLVIHAQKSYFVDSGDNNWVDSQYSVNAIGLSTIWKDSYSYELFTNDDFNIWAWIQLYNPNGELVMEWDIRIEDYNDKPVTYTADTWGYASNIGGIWWNVWDL